MQANDILTKRIIQNNDEILLALNDHLKKFLSDWPLFASLITIDFENPRTSCSDEQVILEFSAIDPIKDTTVEIEIQAIKVDEFFENISYFFNIYIAPESIGVLKKENFDTEFMYETFYYLASKSIGMDYQHPSHLACSFSGDYKPIAIVAKDVAYIYNRGYKEAVTHRIYDWSDESFLASCNIDISHVQHLRNLWFIAKYTNIHKFMEASDLTSLLLEYIDNFECYHVLIAMEKI